MRSARRELPAAIRAALTGQAFQMIDEHDTWRDHALLAAEDLNATAVEHPTGVQSHESRIDRWTSIRSTSPCIEEYRIVAEQGCPSTRVQLTSRRRRRVKASEQSRDGACGRAVELSRLRIQRRGGEQDDAVRESQRTHANLSIERLK